MQKEINTQELMDRLPGYKLFVWLGVLMAGMSPVIFFVIEPKLRFVAAVFLLAGLFVVFSARTAVRETELRIEAFERAERLESLERIVEKGKRRS